MKSLLLTISTFLTLNLSSQNMTPVTRADVNEINLRLDGLDRFGRQHRTGNHLMIAGTLLSGIGSMILYKNTLGTKHETESDYYKAIYAYKTNNKIGNGILGIGAGMMATGLIINIDSFRHLKNKK